MNENVELRADLAELADMVVVLTDHASATATGLPLLKLTRMRGRAQQIADRYRPAA